MASKRQNLSGFNPAEIPPVNGMRIGIVVSEWNREVTQAMLEGATNTLIRLGIQKDHISIHQVPGSFELPLGAKFIADYEKPDAVICLGCVIQGETRHFDYVCQGVTQGITQLNLTYNLPFIFGVLTTDTFEQAMDRAGGKHGNKGDEAAVTALKMAHLKKTLT
jgi:6,7-dimethyl-8-ribityllumazine synthase